ncbi:MAG: hypothetical protein Q8O31_03310 [Rhodocyclaceae bacterium]|nr:hypothetical protein [Rhodocyclaceae bacterium]
MATTIRLPTHLEQTLVRYCIGERKTKSEVIIGLLEQQFIRTNPRMPPYEIAVETGFVGSFEGTGEPSHYKARVKDAIRAKHQR